MLLGSPEPCYGPEAFDRHSPGGSRRFVLKRPVGQLLLGLSGNANEQGDDDDPCYDADYDLNCVVFFLVIIEGVLDTFDLTGHERHYNRLGQYSKHAAEKEWLVLHRRRRQHVVLGHLRRWSSEPHKCRHFETLLLKERRQRFEEPDLVYQVASDTVLAELSREEERDHTGCGKH